MSESNDEKNPESISGPPGDAANREVPGVASGVRRRKFRLWPAGIILVFAVGLIAFFHFRAGDDATQAAMPIYMGPLATAAILLLWWCLGSALAWRVRITGVLVVVVVTGLVLLTMHPSMQMLVMMFGVPVPILLSTLWAMVARGRTGTQIRGAALIACIAVAFCVLLRFDGMSGNGTFALSFRWSSTFDDRAAAYLESVAANEPGAGRSATPLIASAFDWPEFRGLKRDGVVRNAKIRLDWDVTPPKLLWRHPVGLGWSSFAVVGTHAFTQEQRRGEEVVVCYDVATGREIWTLADTDRFSEAMGGDGPRATPTFHGDRVYALGANGILNCLDARTGKRTWSTNILGDGSVENLTWGMAGSPLVFDDIVVVNPGGAEGRGLVAYSQSEGKKIWSGGNDKAGYSSPQLAVLNGKKQVLIFDQNGLAGHDATTGAELWKFAWPTKMANNCVQPHVLNETDILIGTTVVGTLLLRVQADADGWTVTERWRSRYLKLNFNDFVVKENHAYGLDQGILACINLTDGKRAWKQGRYGYGQVLLLDEDKVLLILTEKGEIVLVEASEKAHHEVARFQAIKGKTWNHPVVVGGKLLVRNSEEAACYDISIAQ